MKRVNIFLSVPIMMKNGISYNGSDYTTTLFKTAELVAELLIKYDLRMGDVKKHYDFKEYKEKGGNDVFRGSGNYSSDEAKEFARLKKELKDTQDTLEILKKAIGILGK